MKPVVEKLIKGLELSLELTATQILQQPSLYLEASKYRVEKMKVRMDAEQEFNKVSTKTELRIRSSHEATEKHVAALVKTDPAVIAAEKKFNQEKAMEEWAKLLLNAYDQRGSMCKALVQLLGADAARNGAFLRAELERLGLSRLQSDIRRKFPKQGDDDDA